MSSEKTNKNNRMRRRLENYRIYSVSQAVRHLTQVRSKKDRDLYIATDEVLFNVWDALCLSINQEYRDVYLPYLPQVFDLLKSTTDGQEIYDYLLFVEEIEMDTVPGDALAPRRAARTVNILLDYRNAILMVS